MAEITDEKAEEIAAFFENAIIPTTPNNTPHASIVPVEDKSLSFRFVDLVQSVMNEAQFNILRGETPKHVIKYIEKGGKQFPYVKHGYVRDQLNRAFGFDWDFEVVPMFGGMPFYMVDRTEDGKNVQYVTVVGRLVIRIRKPDTLEVITTITKTEFGSQAWRAKMEFADALKGATSDSLKRCGLSLGIALDLYYNEEEMKQKYDNLEELRNSVREEASQAKQEVMRLHQEHPDWKPIRIVTELKSKNIVVKVPQVAQWIG